MDNKKNVIITVGRQFGSGGKEVANALGKKLGISVYDNELITHAAENSGFSKDLFVRSDEKRSFFSFSNFFAYGRYGGGDTAENYVDDNTLFRIQSDTIRDIASKGSAIFVGRCSDYILRDMDNKLDVFISAPETERIKRISSRRNISEDQARNLISKQERTRETYYNYFTFGNWGVASNYDLCVDSSLLGIDGTVDLIIYVAKAKGLL